MESMRLKTLAAAALGATLLLFPASDIRAQEFERITIGLQLDLDTLDPTQNINTHQRSVYSHLYDPLLMQDADGEFIPWVAERWERIDEKRWRFWLRDDVFFTNGEPVDAEAFRFSATQMQRSTSQASGWFNEFESIEVVEDYVIDFVTRNPWSQALTVLAGYLNAVPPVHYEEVGEEVFSANPVGSGPFVVDSWIRGDRLILKSNPDWTMGVPNAEEVVFWAIPEPATRIAALINGEADMVAAVPALQAGQVEQAPEVRIVQSPSSTQPIWGGLIESRPDLDDVRVRQAINYAVNKEAIVDRLLRGYGRVASQPCPYQRECWNPEIEPYAYDPDRARELLEEAGVTDLQIKLHFPTGVVPQGELLSQAIAADLRRVGIESEIVQDEWTVFAGKLFDFDANQADVGDLFLMYYGAGSTLERIIATVLVSGQIWNWTHFDNERVNDLFIKAQGATDPETHSEAMWEIAEIVHEHAPWLFLYEPFSLWGVSDRIEWQPRLVDDMMLVQDMRRAE